MTAVAGVLLGLVAGAAIGAVVTWLALRAGATERERARDAFAALQSRGDSP